MFLIKKVVFLLMILCAVSGCKTLSKKLNKSGTEFNVWIAADSSDKEVALEQAISQIQKKMNVLGIDGSIAKIDGKQDELSVKIYDKNRRKPEEIERIRNILFTSHQMELKKVVSMPSPRPLQSYPSEEEARKEARDNEEILPYKDTRSGLSSFVIVEKQAIINNDDIRDASVVSGGQYVSIAFSLNPEGAKKLGDWTGRNINNYLAVVIDKKVVSAAYIRSQIFDSGQIDGKFSKEEAEEIASSLKSGYSPLTFGVLDEKHFGL